MPTNRPSSRQDLPPRLYFDPNAKHRYLAAVVEQCWSQQRYVHDNSTWVRGAVHVTQKGAVQGQGEKGLGSSCHTLAMPRIATPWGSLSTPEPSTATWLQW